MTASENWLPADWSAPEGVVAGTTLRNGGVSSGNFESLNLGAYVDDDADAVRENRIRFKALCNLPSEPRWLRQVHGSHVLVDPTADTTGSPDTTAVDMDPPAWLKPGDALEVEISGIGTLKNPVEAE